MEHTQITVDAGNAVCYACILVLHEKFTMRHLIPFVLGCKNIALYIDRGFKWFGIRSNLLFNQ
jgi:hypothetical protein